MYNIIYRSRGLGYCYVNLRMISKCEAQLGEFLVEAMAEEEDAEVVVAEEEDAEVEEVVQPEA